jgi:hypothetical protein
MTDAEIRAYTRAYDIATSRAESRRRLGLPIERAERINSDEIETDR